MFEYNIKRNYYYEKTNTITVHLEEIKVWWMKSISIKLIYSFHNSTYSCVVCIVYIVSIIWVCK